MLKTELADAYTTLANVHAAEARPAEGWVSMRRPRPFTKRRSRKTASRVIYKANWLGRSNNLGLARPAPANPWKASDVERGRDPRAAPVCPAPSIDRRADLARTYYHLAQIHVLTGASAKAKEKYPAEERTAGIGKPLEVHSTFQGLHGRPLSRAGQDRQARWGARTSHATATFRPVHRAPQAGRRSRLLKPEPLPKRPLLGFAPVPARLPEAGQIAWRFVEVKGVGQA